MDEIVAAWLYERHMQHQGYKVRRSLFEEDPDIVAAWLDEARALLKLLDQPSSGAIR